MPDLDASPGRVARSWEFLERPAEQLRHAVVASLIARERPGLVVDLGCGHGHLLRWLQPEIATGYLGVDQDAVLLKGLSHRALPVETIASTLEAFDPAGRVAGTLVCADVLYYIDDPDQVLARIVSGFTRLERIIATAIIPRPERANWVRSVGRMWEALGRLGWPELERVRVTSAAAQDGWDVVMYGRQA